MSELSNAGERPLAKAANYLRAQLGRLAAILGPERSVWDPNIVDRLDRAQQFLDDSPTTHAGRLANTLTQITNRMQWGQPRPSIEPVDPRIYEVKHGRAIRRSPVWSPDLDQLATATCPFTGHPVTDLRLSRETSVPLSPTRGYGINFSDVIRLDLTSRSPRTQLTSYYTLTFGLNSDGQRSITPTYFDSSRGVLTPVRGALLSDAEIEAAVGLAINLATPPPVDPPSILNMVRIEPNE